MSKVGQIYKYENVGLFVISNIQDIDDEFYEEIEEILGDILYEERKETELFKN